MAGSISKYFGTKTDSLGNPIFWGHPSDFPFRGDLPPMLKGDEYDKIPLVYDAKSAWLDIPKDQERYDSIIDHCANGWWQMRHERFYEGKDGTLKVFLAWLEVHGEVPNSKSAWDSLKHDG